MYKIEDYFNSAAPRSSESSACSTIYPNGGIQSHYTVGAGGAGGISSNGLMNIDGTVSATDIVISGKSITETLSKINDRLLILEPKKELLEKYESLKNAYDHYKLMEKLLTESET